MRFVRSSCAVFLGGIAVLGSGDVGAQSLLQPTTLTVSSPTQGGDGTSQQQNRLITIEVKEQSIASVLAEIARQSDVRLFYSPDNPDLGKKVTISLKKVTPIDAVNTVIRGINLVARKTTDGQGIMIRAKTDTAQKGSAQVETSSIVGVVVDSAGQKPVVGATVTLSARPNAPTVTNDKGIFRFDNVAIGSHQIAVRMLGYVAKHLTVTVESGKVATPKIVLATSATSLSEVVTTATGQQRRVEIAHDIAKIDPKVIMERTPVRTVVDLLEAAQIPGVLVQRQSGDPGAPTRIRIRGIGSISQSNDPVVILDGVWIDASTSTPSRLDEIDPAMIETLEIIRGPSAATLFGQDASNGVIVITTKKGKAGPTRWNLSYRRDWGQTYGTLPLIYEGAGTRTGTSDRVSCNVQAVLRYSCVQDTVFIYDPNHRLLSREGTETNQQFVAQIDGGAANVAYAVTASTSQTIGVRRGSPLNNIRYRILGYVPASEFNKPSELKKNSLTTNITLNPRSNVNMGITVTGTQSTLKDNVMDHSWALPAYGSIRHEFSLDTVFRGPLAISTIRANEQPVRTTTGIVATSIQYRPRGAWVLNGNFGFEKNIKNTSSFTRVTNCTLQDNCWDTTGTASEQGDNRSVYTIRLNASTSLNLGPLNRFLEIRPSIGGDFKKTDNQYLSISKRDIPVGSRSLSAGNLSFSTATFIENATAGWYLNSTFGLFRRIYFDMGIRQDIGSAITSSTDAVYPKIGGSWLVSDESFWKENRWINNLRLRSAIGHAAVQPDLSDIYGKFVNDIEYIDGRFVQTVDLRGIGNNRLQPERAVEVELGFDLDMLDNRLNVIGTYAHTENKNTLVVRTTPPSLGSSSRKENVARVRNRNFELSVDARAIESQRLLVILNYALTLSDNVVSRLGSGITPFVSTEMSRIQQGYPLAGVWNRAVLGYRDTNGDGMISEDELIQSDSVVYLGWSQPRHRASYGISITLNNQLTFDSRFAYQSRYVQSFTMDGGYGAEDIRAPLSEQAYALVYGKRALRPVTDLRWNSASIVYHLPQAMLSKFGGRAVSISLQGSNLGLWTNYAGRDPGVNSNLLNGDLTADNGRVPPRPRLFVLDFKVGF